MESNKKVTRSESQSPDESEVTHIWANDGWCYIPEKGVRRRFTETQTIQQNWNGVIAMPEYVEKAIWKEDEPCEQKSPSQADHMSKPRRQVRRQQPQQP